MRRRRVNPIYLATALLVVATIVYAVVTVGAGDQTSARRTGSVYDDGPGGAAALRRYLEAMGAGTTTVQGDAFGPDARQAAALLVLGVTEIITTQDAHAIEVFVRAGGTAIVATDLGVLERPLLDAFGFGVAGIAAPGSHPLAGTTFADPVARSFAIDRGVTYMPGAFGLVVATDGRGPVVVGRRSGQGVLYLVGSISPFIASGLGEADNARFVLGLVHDAVARHGQIAFDEYHHGFHPTTDVLVLLQRTWPGRALVFASVAAFLYLVLSGRRLGAPVPLDPRPPRSSLEYIRGFAGLVRRSGRGEIARRRLRRDLRSGLARKLGLDPGTPFDRVLVTLAVTDRQAAAEARAVDEALERGLRDDQLLRSVREVERLVGGSR